MRTRAFRLLWAVRLTVGRERRQWSAWSLELMPAKTIRYNRTQLSLRPLGPGELAATAIEAAGRELLQKLSADVAKRNRWLYVPTTLATYEIDPRD